jgi:hypothetical protein
MALKVDLDTSLNNLRGWKGIGGNAGEAYTSITTDETFFWIFNGRYSYLQTHDDTQSYCKSGPYFETL